MCSFLWLQGYGHCDILDKAGYNRKYTIDFYHARDWEARMSNSKDAFSTLFVITYHSFIKLYYTIDFYQPVTEEHGCATVRMLFELCMELPFFPLLNFLLRSSA